MLKHLTPDRRIAYLIGIVVAFSLGAWLLAPGREPFHMAGPHNTGHDDIRCAECHKRAAGNVPGQVLGNLAAAVGLSNTDPDFVFRPAGNEECLACHDNPDDRHPVADFVEAEFADARAAIGAHRCVSCHRQHRGVRVSADQTFCQHCHADPVVEDDPIDIPHETLAADGRWATCLGCHDFHGNHSHAPPERLSEALPGARIRAYLDGGASPYGHRRVTAVQTMRDRPRDAAKP